MAGSRARLFIENFLIYGVGNVLTKAVPFLMLPVLTRLITDPAVFGVYDIYNIIIRFATPLAVLGCYDAMFRLFFDDSDPHFQKEICSSSLAIVLTTSLFALFITLILWISGISFIEGYRWLIPIAGLVISSHAIQNIVAAPTRMQNQRQRIIVISLLAPMVYYFFAMILAWSGWPLEGLVFGNLLSGILVLMIYGLLNNSFFSLKSVKIEYIKELLKIGIPLAPTFLIYWIFTSCDRFMLGHFIGIEAVGLYGIGARLSSISQGIYMAFAGGWQYFAFSTMKDEDHTQLMSRVFEVLGVLSITCLVLLLPFVGWIFHIMVAKQYQGASVVFPYLFISPLLLMLSQIAGTQIIVEKKTYLSTLTRLLGAFVNVGLNLWWIPVWGAKGAAMATFVGYLVMTISVGIIAIKMNRLLINARFLFVSLLGLLIIATHEFLGEDIIVLSVFFFAGIALLYRKEAFTSIEDIRRWRKTIRKQGK